MSRAHYESILLYWKEESSAWFKYWEPLSSVVVIQCWNVTVPVLNSSCATCAIAGCPGCGVNRLLTSMRLWVTAHSLALRVPVWPVLYLSSSAGYYFIFTLYAEKHECSLFIHSEIKIPKQKLFWGVDSHPPGRRMGQGRALLSPCE